MADGPAGSGFSSIEKLNRVRESNYDTLTDSYGARRSVQAVADMDKTRARPRHTDPQGPQDERAGQAADHQTQCRGSLR